MTQKHIAFWDNSLSERGSTTALFDYALYNETILNNKSFIFYNQRDKNNDPNIIYKFKSHFPTTGVNQFKHINKFITENQIQYLYIIKFGHRDNKTIPHIKNLIHCVFDCRFPHGDVYASVGPWVIGAETVPTVPHIVNPPLPPTTQNPSILRSYTPTATIFGSYGGKDSFNIKYVHETIQKIATQFPNYYFIFANFDNFLPPNTNQKNIIFLPKITDPQEKANFINQCDAMIHAQKLGETFGLAVAEFAIQQKPIISCKYSEDNRTNHGHVNILKENAFWYNDEESLTKIFTNWNTPESKANQKTVAQNAQKAYQEFSPEKVMSIFNNVFLS
jgi:glycosyltransferase involved in cell wall biosynthesis